MKTILILLLFAGLNAAAQEIPKNANTIIIKGVGFLEVCNRFLDSGYSFKTKDMDLQTARTEERKYPKSWNATYTIDIRVKDSTAYLSGKCTAPPGGGLALNEPVYYWTNKKGKLMDKGLFYLPFLWMQNIALSFNKPVEYLIQ